MIFLHNCFGDSGFGLKKSVFEVSVLDSVDAVVNAPPSKAYTLRGLFVSALAEGQSVIKNALRGDDQKVAARVLSEFGARISFRSGNYLVEGTNGFLSAPSGEVFTGDSGVTTRFIIPVASIAEGTSIIIGSEQMNRRPVEPLVSALNKIGGSVVCLDGVGLPVEVHGKGVFGLRGGSVSLSGSISSQFFSALLVSAPYTQRGVLISVDGGLKSKPYIDNTINCMRFFGVPVVNRGYKEFFVRGNSKYVGRDFVVEGDYSSASYFFAAAAIVGGRVRVNNLNPNSLQADKFFLNCLSKMGCSVRFGSDFVEVSRAKNKRLVGISVNLSDCPDVVPTLAVVSAFAEGKTVISGVEHLALKESNRINSIVSNLKRCGVVAVSGFDRIEVVGGNPVGCEIEVFNDHRIAMAFSVMGLRVPGIVIKDPWVVSKSYPNFFEDFKKLYS